MIKTGTKISNLLRISSCWIYSQICEVYQTRLKDSFDNAMVNSPTPSDNIYTTSVQW